MNSVLLLLQATSSTTWWVPIFATIFGGLLVWIGQYIERNSRNGNERQKDLREIYAFCRKLEAQMKNNYRELAMAKVHVEYWWHCYNSPSSFKEKLPRYYDEHLRSQSYDREIERRIGDTKADFIAHVRKFQAIKSIPLEVEHDLEVISDLTHPKAKTYDSLLDYDDLRNNIVDKDEKELREKYYENLMLLKRTNDMLQKLLEK